VNNDGILIWYWGNKFGFQPQFCQLDASFGEVLLNRKGAISNHCQLQNPE
jgi:hypothetical protein